MFCGLTVQEELIYFSDWFVLVLPFFILIFLFFSFPVRINPCGTLKKKNDLGHMQHINVSLLSEVMCAACYPLMREKKDCDHHADSRISFLYSPPPRPPPPSPTLLGDKSL